MCAATARVPHHGPLAKWLKAPACRAGIAGSTPARTARHAPVAMCRMHKCRKAHGWARAASVARAPDYEAGGREFNSLRARQECARRYPNLAEGPGSDPGDVRVRISGGVPDLHRREPTRESVGKVDGRSAVQAREPVLRTGPATASARCVQNGYQTSNTVR